MCLTNLTTKKAKTAKEDIVCYKTLLRGMKSPYEGYLYTQGNTVRSELHVEDTGEINYGLHSFVSKRGAEDEILSWNEYNTPNVYRCIIPQGAKYFEGVCDYNPHSEKPRKSYASNELIVLEKL